MQTALRRLPVVTAVALQVLLASTISGQPQPAGGSPATNVSFSKDIAPILQKKCLACHGPEKKKGGYQLLTYDLLMKGGESKSPAITPGKPDQSKLFQLITTKDPDDRMPQKDDPLAADQIVLIERWIRQGARFDGPDPKATLLELIPRLAHPSPPETYPRAIPVLALAFSADGLELAAGGYHEITIWNPADGKLTRRVTNIAQRTQSLDYQPNGSLLAAGGGSPGQSGEVALIDAKQGAVVKVLAVLPDVVLDLKFNSDGSRLAAAGADNSIRVFDVSSGKEELRIEQHADWVMGIAWSPDGTHLVSASRDKTARIFDSRSGDLENTYIDQGAPIFSVTYSDDGKLVYSAGRDKKIHIWNVKDAKKAGEVGGFDDEIYRLIVRSNHLFSCSADKTAREHSATDKRGLIRTYSGHSDCVFSLAYDQKAKRLATGSFDGEVRIWNAENGNLISSFIAAPGRRLAVN